MAYCGCCGVGYGAGAMVGIGMEMTGIVILAFIAGFVAGVVFLALAADK